jgi:PAS domain S-box-containing protein
MAVAFHSVAKSTAVHAPARANSFDGPARSSSPTSLDVRLSLLDNLPFAAFRVDPNGNFHYANKTLIDYFGFFSVEHFLHCVNAINARADLVPAPLELLVRQIRDFAARGEEQSNFEIQTSVDPAASRQLLISLTSVRDDQEKTLFVDCAAYDISRQRGQEKALRESEARFREMFEYAPLSFWEEDWSLTKEMLDRLREDGVRDWRAYFANHEDELKTAADLAVVIAVNDATVKIYKGFSKEDVIATTTADKMSAEEFQAFTDQLIAFAEGELAFSARLREQALDGSEVTTQLRAVIPPKYRETWSRVLYTIEDITEIESAREALHSINLELYDSNARFESVIENMPGAIYRLDVGKKKIVFISKAIEEISGFENQDFTTGETQHFLKIIHPEDREMVQDELARSLSRRAPVSIEYRISRKDGGIRWVQERARPTLDEGGIVRWLDGAIFDITEKKRQDAEKVDLLTQLHQAQKLQALGTLAGGTAHEFNNLLVPIIGLTEIAKNDLPEGSEHHENLGGVLQAADTARKLVAEILNFSRQGTGISNAPHDLGSSVRETVQLLRRTIPPAIELRDSVATGPLLVSVGPTEVHQILLNLVSNAVDAMGAVGGAVDVTLRMVTGRTPKARRSATTSAKTSAGRFAKLTLKDHGSGMSKSVKERIFEPFFTTKEVGKGTGMGLSIIHSILSRHGGEIEIESCTGKGTKISVYLPLIDEKKSLDDDEPRRPATGLPASCRDDQSGHDRAE